MKILLENIQKATIELEKLYSMIYPEDEKEIQSRLNRYLYVESNGYYKENLGGLDPLVFDWKINAHGYVECTSAAFGVGEFTVPLLYLIDDGTFLADLEQSQKQTKNEKDAKERKQKIMEQIKKLQEELDNSPIP